MIPPRNVRGGIILFVMSEISKHKLLFMCLFFGCFEMATEVTWVALSNLVMHSSVCDKPVWALTGNTYLWMFPIYAIIPVLASPVISRIRSLHVLIRLLIYATTLYVVEFLSGMILDLVTGSCPWEYTSAGNVMGYIQLKYLPAWMLFTFLIERLYLYLDRQLH